MNIKPGDLIEWAYLRTRSLVCKNETLWSSVDEKWVPIGSELTHLCVSCDGKIITWLNEKGLFRAREDDGLLPDKGGGAARPIVPRMCRRGKR
jgi:hypothetical protein